MEIRSLGYRTDLDLLKFSGEIVDHGSYIAVRTPSNPAYYWGNFLLFDAPPKPGDLESWRSLFAREIGLPPDIRHIAFGWDTATGETGEIQPFLDAGFHLSQSIVLTAEKVQRPPKYNEEVQIRPLTQEAEWEQMLQNQIACRDPEHDLEGYTRFATRQMERYRAMTRAGLGLWFGAFLGTRLAGDLGLFVQEGVGRFQAVGTHPDFRRRGICGTLVYQAASYAFSQRGAATLVMVADEHYHAAKIYESVGFAPTERQVGMDWWERDEP